LSRLIDRYLNIVGWPLGVARQFPVRLGRLGRTLAATAAAAVAAAVDLVPETALILHYHNRARTARWARGKAAPAGWSLAALAVCALDVAGISELVEYVWRGLAHTSPLSTQERAAAASVMGDTAIHWDAVRVAEAGILTSIFRRNGGRAFALFHTVNLPAGPRGRADLSIVVHELVHVRQYERHGSLYIVEALRAQANEGYNYGGPDGLAREREQGRRYHHYNREQQAQIAQDYFIVCRAANAGSESTAAAVRACYEPYIKELREGNL
jgi:hypothetical protein